MYVRRVHTGRTPELEDCVGAAGGRGEKQPWEDEASNDRSHLGSDSTGLPLDLLLGDYFTHGVLFFLS